MIKVLLWNWWMKPLRYWLRQPNAKYFHSFSSQIIPAFSCLMFILDERRFLCFFSGQSLQCFSSINEVCPHSCCQWWRGICYQANRGIFISFYWPIFPISLPTVFTVYISICFYSQGDAGRKISSMPILFWLGAGGGLLAITIPSNKTDSPFLPAIFSPQYVQEFY